MSSKSGSYRFGLPFPMRTMPLGRVPVSARGISVSQVENHSLDTKRMIARFAPGIEIPLHPFFGSMGVAPPPSSGRISSNPPWIHAGNLDNKDLVAGTTLYIPIHAKGANFEVGRRPRRPGQWRSRRHRAGNFPGRNLSIHCAKRHASALAARRNPNSFHDHGPARKLE